MTKNLWKSLYGTIRSEMRDNPCVFGCDRYGRLQEPLLRFDVESVEINVLGHALRELLVTPKMTKSLTYAMMARFTDDGLIAYRLWGPHADRWFAVLTGR